MNITSEYKSIVAAQYTKKLAYEKLAEEQLKIRNAAYYAIIKPENDFINKVTLDLQKEMGANFKVTNSCHWLTIVYNGFTGEFPYQKFRKIASVNLGENKIHFQFDGASHVTKVMKFKKDLTTQKIAKLIYKYGIMICANSSNQ